MASYLPWLILLWTCAGVFTALGLGAAKHDPVHLWCGDCRGRERVTDEHGWKKSHRRMWLLYAMPYWVSGLVAFLWADGAAALLIVSACAGLWWLLWMNGRLEKQFVAEAAE